MMAQRYPAVLNNDIHNVKILWKNPDNIER